MMSDIATITLRMNTSELERGNKVLDDFQNTATGAAGKADDLNRVFKAGSESQRRNADSTRQQQQELQVLLNKISPVNRALNDLDTLQSSLSKYRGKGLVDTETYARYNSILDATRVKLAQVMESETQDGRAKQQAALDSQRAAAAGQTFVDSLQNQVAAINKTRSEILELKAAQLGVSTQSAPLIARLREQENAWKRGVVSAGQYRQAMRLLPAQITDITTSLAGGMPIWLVAIQQGGQIKDSFGGIGNTLRALISLITPFRLVLGGLAAGVGLVAYQFYKNSSQLDAFSQALAKSGNQAGLTREQLSVMADILSKASGASKSSANDAVAQAAALKLTADGIRSYADAVLVTSKNTGESVDDLTSKINNLSGDPVRALVTLGEQYNYLTPQIYEQVKALTEQGDKAGAMKIVVDSLAQSQRNLADDSPGWSNRLSDAWQEVTDGITGAWTALKNYNAENGKNSGKGLGVSVGGKNLPGYNPYAAQQSGGNADAVKLAQDLTAALQKQNTEEAKAAKARQQQRESDAAKARYQFDQETSSFESNAAKRKKAIEELDRLYKQSNGSITEAEYNQRKLDIADRYKDPKTPKIKGVTTSSGDRAEDAAQAELLALQAQLKTLQDHRSINDVISQQRKDLYATEAKFSVLEDASKTRQLSAQEKSLLASKDQVLQLARQKALLGDQITAQEQLNKRMDTAQKYATQMAEKQQALLDGSTKSDRLSQRDRERAQLRIGWQNAGGSLDDEGYKSELKAAEQYYSAEDALRSDWLAGAKKGWAEYADTATDVYASAQQVAQAGFNGLADMMTNLVVTGKASFKEFSTSVLKMIVDIINKLLIAYTVQQALGWINSSASSSFTSTGLNDGTSGVPAPPKFDVGGYTGDGGKYDPKGIVHGGEFVFTKEATAAIGIGNLYSMMRGAQGYADGGYVGKAPMYGLQSSGGGNTIVQTSVVVQSDNASTQNSSNSDAMARAYQQTIDRSVKDGIARETRQGGLIWRAQNKR